MDFFCMTQQEIYGPQADLYHIEGSACNGTVICGFSHTLAEAHTSSSIYEEFFFSSITISCCRSLISVISLCFFF